MGLVDLDKYILDSIDMVTGFDPATGKLDFIFDEVTDGSVENGSETVFLTGKLGRRVAALDRNKTATLSFNNAFMVGGGLATQIGSVPTIASVSNKLVVPNVEILTVGSTDTVILSETPVGATGAEIPFVYKCNSDGTQGQEYAIAAQASASAFSLNVGTKTITLPTGVFTEGDRVIVCYDYETSVGKKYVNSGDSFSKTERIIIDVTIRDACNNSVCYHGRFVFTRAKVEGTFNIGIGGDTPEAHAFSAEAITNVCDTDKRLWEFYIVE